MLPGPRGLPLLKPPFASIVAIDMNSGEHRWRIPVGHSRAMGSIRRLDLPDDLGLLGAQLGADHQDGHGRGADGLCRPAALRARLQPAASATCTISIRGCGSMTRRRGENIAELELPANATGSPITYMAGGKQFIVFAIGGGPLPEELVAVALP